MRILVTGGAGFIGSELVRQLITETEHEVMNVDKLTYAGNLQSLKSIANNPRYHFLQADVADADKIREVFAKFKPESLMHLAAESHVDRSIDGPAEFIRTNILGTYTLLEAARNYWSTLETKAKESFRFLHVSTDEVFGSLGEQGFFSESSAYDPSSPYSASKASSDHLVRAWQRTFGLPTLITNCSNNYGPYHFPEKLIPLIILNALEGKKLPVYGKGDQVRDWLYVSDHARALRLVLEKGRVGETYNVGGRNEKRNLEVVECICDLLDTLAPHATIARHRELIHFVADRPGHDKRYAIDATKLEQELGWRASESFESGIEKTLRWYLENQPWWEAVRSGSYRGERLGLGEKA